MQPYRFNPFEMDLLRRLTNKVYLKSEHFEFGRYPIIYFGDSDESEELINEPQKNNLNFIDTEKNGKYDIDLLGCYRYQHIQEGYIEIYGDRIHDCATSISAELGSDFIETRSLLQTIVLLHEIGHWFTHSCFKLFREERMESFEYQTLDITETLAQLSVLWSTLGLSNSKVKEMYEIMNHLTMEQSMPYKQYLKLGKHYTRKLTILNRYVKLLDIGNCDLDYLLLRNKKPNPHRTI
jgi:hypothetical protein